MVIQADTYSEVTGEVTKGQGHHSIVLLDGGPPSSEATVGPSEESQQVIHKVSEQENRGEKGLGQVSTTFQPTRNLALMSWFLVTTAYSLPNMFQIWTHI